MSKCLEAEKSWIFTHTIRSLDARLATVVPNIPFAYQTPAVGRLAAGPISLN